MFSVGDLFSQASPIGRAMQSPTRSPMTFFDGQGTTEPTTERTERAQIAEDAHNGYICTLERQDTRVAIKLQRTYNVDSHQMNCPHG